MRFPSKATVALLRQRYPVGTRVELVQMDDGRQGSGYRHSLERLHRRGLRVH